MSAATRRGTPASTPAARAPLPRAATAVSQRCTVPATAAVSARGTRLSTRAGRAFPWTLVRGSNGAARDSLMRGLAAMGATC